MNFPMSAFLTRFSISINSVKTSKAPLATGAPRLTSDGTHSVIKNIDFEGVQIRSEFTTSTS